MKKLSSNFKKYVVFILVCFVPFLVSASIKSTNVISLQNNAFVSLTSINKDVLYRSTISLLEVAGASSAKAYPGDFGSCEFNSDWEYTNWFDASGKKYSFFETTKSGAKLPNCTASSNNAFLVFKGWKKGYKVGDTITTKTSCGTGLLSAGATATLGENYAPCYEMAPHVRLSVNAGSVSDTTVFKFNPSDMTYVATGTSYTQEVVLPDVVYAGFNSSNKLENWRNDSTGEIKQPGDKVKLDGSVWVAVTSRTVVQIDLYKTVGLGETSVFTVSGMNNCKLSSSSSYISVSYSGGDCTVKGLVATPYDVYADVEISLSDGNTRIYKFNVEDRSNINNDDNGIFNVDISDNVEIGENDDLVLNGFTTDQCKDFFITNNGYVRFTFAYSKSTGEAMNTGIYSVYPLCDDDKSKYVGLCLDPGRRGPNEAYTGSHNRTINGISMKGNEYTKSDEIKRDSEFGKLIIYIVENMGIEDFDNNSSPTKERRAASHVAVRSMAIADKLSTDPDPADLAYASHYYPYQGLADAILAALSDGDISGTEANDIVNNGSGGNGFKNWDSSVKSNLIQILSDYGSVSTDSKDDGFERTIDKTDYSDTNNGKGYKINYQGTITAPTGATATMSKCSNPGKYGVTSCTINNDSDGDGWVSVSEQDGRKVYTYDVTILVDDASVVIPPTNTEEEKELSFQIQYTGGHDFINAFIASPTNGSDNVQRMLIINTSNPKAYIYFSIIPKSCDLEVLDPVNCSSESSCTNFNAALFKAAGCCRYLLDEESYVFKNVCVAECTSSTLTSVCKYVSDGKTKADFYEINEGAKYNGSTYANAIGTCVVNVTDLYKNDSGAPLKSVTNYQNFIKYDDASNLINVDSYNSNRYCQVTCEEDWELSMDSFGNFIGENAVAAGTYFQIVSNDMFIGAKRTCYTTFINYDRFMNNIVKLSNELVKYYNSYSRWSHVWTDIDARKDTDPQFTHDPNGTASSNIKCVEYFDKCPQGGSNGVSGQYYWSNEVNNCRQVPNYGSSSGSGGSPKCQSKPSSYSGYSHYDGEVSYTNSGANNDSTQCTFKRWYCDGNKDDFATDTINSSNKMCYYYTYYDKDSESQDYYEKDCTYDPETKKTTCEPCDSGYYSSGSYCKENTPSGWTRYGSTFYKNCDSGYSSYNSYYCRSNTQSSYSASVDTLYMDPAYNTQTLKCKVWGKGYSYTLKTKNDVEVKIAGQINAGGEDLYYGTSEFDPQDLADNTVGGGNANTQNKQSSNGNVKGNYAKTYTHKCTVTEAAYEPGAKGSSSCKQDGLVHELTAADSYSKTNDMFCADSKFADLTGGDLDKAFCYAGGSSSNTNTNTDATKDYADYSNEKKAFEFIQSNFKEHAEKETDVARAKMTSLNSQIYSHAQDVFDCQNFQLHNRTDDSNSTHKNNTIKTDTIMGLNRSYVKINTDYDPTAAYTYDEAFFMERLGKDNVLVPYTEKNDALYGGDGQYGNSTNAKVDATINTPSGTVNTQLYRNYLETSYYNPLKPWTLPTNKTEINEYHQDSSAVSPEKAEKKVVLCTVGVINHGTGYAEGKDGAVVPFASTSSTPKWLGGKCFQVTVDYKKVHYVKSSISNSSYYKNKGNWYVRGGDSKIHGDTISDAINNFNSIKPSGYIKNYDNSPTEHLNWSRLGSFNVFPISMATPRNLYQYTYTFGNIGSYSDGKLGRIMGTEKSIIQNNKRTCFYEVYEEVCLCCGYQIKPGDLVEQFVNTNGGFNYQLSDPSKAGGNTSGSISFYTNSVSLGDIDLGRDNVANNWSDNALFMYNGDDSLTTDKGGKLKNNIEYKGENVYASQPEYAYFLTPDTLKQIRSYNDANGYDLNLDKLKVYEVDNIACDGSNCKTGSAETISFQHYGSKFLIGDISGPIQLNSYGSIKNTNNKVCIIKDSTYSANTDLSSKIENEGCRWIDYIETNNSYYNPTTKTSSNTWFRLAFK